MPPPSHKANTPPVSGAAAISDSVNGRLALVIDMLPSPRCDCLRFYACISAVAAHGGYMSNRSHKHETQNVFSRLGIVRRSHSGCRRTAIKNLEESEASMPLKHTGALCHVREQIIEDAPSGITLQFECDDGR